MLATRLVKQNTMFNELDKPAKSDKKPRVTFPLRLEPELVEQMDRLLKNAKKSRNDFIAGVIRAELQHIERFLALNVDPFEEDGDASKNRK